MEPTRQQLIFFSPTQTTERVLSAIAEGTGIQKTSQLDLTRPAAETMGETDIADALVIIGAPVYAGRVPLDAVRRLEKIRGSGAPAIVTVVYGNREFDDALLELRDIAVKAGFVPVAAAAFIGEHSFANEATPVANGRPDASDLEAARRFGRSVMEKLSGLESADAVGSLSVPGNSPYKERKVRSGISPETADGVCTLCETCASVCPTAAITVSESVATDKERCILCCACVKRCPSGAREMTNPSIQQVAEWLHTNFSERKEAAVFI